MGGVHNEGDVSIAPVKGVEPVEGQGKMKGRERVVAKRRKKNRHNGLQGVTSGDKIRTKKKRGREKRHTRENTLNKVPGLSVAQKPAEDNKEKIADGLIYRKTAPKKHVSTNMGINRQPAGETDRQTHDSEGWRMKRGRRCSTRIRKTCLDWGKHGTRRKKNSMRSNRSLDAEDPLQKDRR